MNIRPKLNLESINKHNVEIRTLRRNHILNANRNLKEQTTQRIKYYYKSVIQNIIDLYTRICDEVYYIEKSPNEINFPENYEKLIHDTIIHILHQTYKSKLTLNEIINNLDSIIFIACGLNNRLKTFIYMLHNSDIYNMICNIYSFGEFTFCDSDLINRIVIFSEDKFKQLMYVICKFVCDYNGEYELNELFSELEEYDILNLMDMGKHITFDTYDSTDYSIL